MKAGYSTRSDFLKRNTEGSDAVMERRTGTPIEKWDDVNGTALASSGYMELSDDSNVMPMITGDISQGERFIQLRESTGMNRKEFSEYLDIPYRTMSDWENNLRTMPAYVFSLIEYKIRTEFGMKLPQELDPNTLGNVRRGLEDQIEQNDNNLDGVINNVRPEEPASKIKDDNSNGIPDEEEIKDEARKAHEPVDRKEEKVSILKQLHEVKHGTDPEHEIKPLVPMLGL